jgi:hypothetical protein
LVAEETCGNRESSGFCGAIFAVLFPSRAAQLHQENQRRNPEMSAPLVVSIPHRLGREEAVRRLKGGLGRAAASVPVLNVDEERWEGDQMFFRVRALGQAASGHINVAEDHVRLEVTLPWLLQRFAEMAQIAIRDRGKLLLTKRD